MRARDSTEKRSDFLELWFSQVFNGIPSFLYRGLVVDLRRRAESEGRVVRARHVAEAGGMPTPRPEDGGGILSGGGA